MDSLSVFVCSTYADLSEERGAVLDAIRRLKLQHDSMEFFGARASRPLETCLEEVRRSNIMVVIVGHRYGTIAPGIGVSFSEAEYKESQRLGKPSLVYMRDDSVPVLLKNVERDPDKVSRLDSWKAVLQERHTVATFRESSDLALQVAADLSRTIAELHEANRAREQAAGGATVSALHEIAPLVEHAKSLGIAERVLLSAVRRAIAAVVSETQELGPSVFLSYSRADTQIVLQVADRLKEAAMAVWLDQAKLVAGDNWISETERALDSADYVAFFISSSSLGSAWARRELQLAMHRQVAGERGAFILPVLLEKVEVPPLLRDIHWIDMTDGNTEKGAQALVQAIDRHTVSAVMETAYTPVEHSPESVPEQKVIAVLEEELGNVGVAAKRLGLSPRRLYKLLNHYNIQARVHR